MSDKPKKEKKEKVPKEKKEKKNNKVKICPNCQTEIPKKAKVCPSCAAKQKGPNPLPLIIAVAAVLVIGVGVYLFVFHFPVDLGVKLPILSGPKLSETVLGQGMELTAKQEEAMLAILEECGFKEITQVTKLTTDSTTTSYAVQDADTERFMSATDPVVVRVENDTKALHSIIFQNSAIYANEEVVSKITSYYLDMAERDVFMEETLYEVKARLDLPELAVFPSRSHWNFYEDEGDVLIIESYVTVKDATGAEVVRPFLARFEDSVFVSLTFTEEES